MKTTLSMVALVALLASGCVPSSVAEQANVTTSAKPTTRLYVRTTPPGAKIRIDGKEKPKTSPQLFEVPLGVKSMTVEVELGRHPGQRKVVVIEGGRIIRVEFKFDAKPERPPKKVHLPDADTPGAGVVLDLGTGDLLKIQDPDDHVTTFSRLGRGDLFFDRALACLRGAKAMQWDGKRFVDLPARDRRLDATVYMLPSVPCRLLITTAEKKHFDVTILALSKKDTGIDLEYREADPAVVPQLTRHFVRLVVDKDRMTFQGEDTNWEELPKLLEKIADRRHTVLRIARAPGKITAEQWNEAQGKAVGLVRRFDFQHLSIIGVHPLGSKGEGTRTLPEATAQSPAGPSTGIPARSIWDRVMNPPEGWKVQRSLIVPRDQVATIEKKLGGRIKKLSNTVFSAHGEQVQVNVFECATGADAEKIHEAVLAMKGDPAYGLRFDKTIVEFVGTFDVAFAKRAARELGLIPSPVKAKRVRLPDADTPGARVVLDLASGEMFDVVRERDVPAQFKGLGKGDLFFDRVLGCLRGAQAMWWDGARFVPLPSADRQGDATAYKLPGLPCRLLITTAEKRQFDVTILAVTDDGGIDLEYRPADPAVVPPTNESGSPAAHSTEAEPAQQRSEVQAATARIASLSTVLELYRSDQGSYPTTEQSLEELRRRGQYIKGFAQIDPWKKPYRYESPGKHNPNSFDLWSVGPDGTDGTADDVRNWGVDKKRPLPPVKKICLPEPAKRGDRWTVFDLASGKISTIAEEQLKDPEVFNKAGIGDLLHVDSLHCVRGAKAEYLEDGGFAMVKVNKMVNGVTSYTPRVMPCRLRITTAEKKQFDVTLLTVTQKGMYLEYRPADQAVVPEESRTTGP